MSTETNVKNEKINTTIHPMHYRYAAYRDKKMRDSYSFEFEDVQPLFKIYQQVKTESYRGTITAIYEKCPMSNYWLSRQKTPILAESVNDFWYSLSVDTGGAVSVPQYRLKAL